MKQLEQWSGDGVATRPDRGVHERYDFQWKRQDRSKHHQE